MKARLVSVALCVALPISACSAVLGIDEATPLALDCESYCALVENACPASGPHRQYTSVGDCKALCSKMAMGENGDDNRNTVACRMKAAERAVDDASECIEAGPLGARPGATGCGESSCQNFCELATKVCVGLAIDSNPDCANACERLSVLEGDQFATSSGPSLNCRVVHLGYAAGGDVVAHCPHVRGDAICK